MQWEWKGEEEKMSSNWTEEGQIMKDVRGHRLRFGFYSELNGDIMQVLGKDVI